METEPTTAQVPRPAIDLSRLTRIGHELLEALGEDPSRDGLRETPQRFASWWREFIEYDPGKTDTVFESVGTGDMVIVSGLRVWSLCEHHCLPFWCDLSIGYIPNKQVLGLSKFARVAHQHAHKLQIQERLVREICDGIHQTTQSEEVIVLGQGEHLCMVMRGVRTNGLMTTVSAKGRFQSDAALRAEFLQLARPSP